MVVVDKPAGMTSHDVVARARRQLGTRRVGHAGTLDPLATGVLVLGVDRATRLLGHLALQVKSYDATIRLGVTTVTDDAEGQATGTATPDDLAAVSDEQIAAGLAAQTGRVLQRPSSVSAIKVDGRRAYSRVRAGEEVLLPEREVEISTIDVGAVRRSSAGAIDLDVRVTCSSGTYIRAIARDLGAGLGVGGHLTALRRTEVGPFGLGEAVDVDSIAEGVQSMDRVAARCFAVLVLDQAQEGHARHGRPMDWPAAAGSGVHALMSSDGALVALAEPEGSRLRYLAVLGAG